MVSKRGIVMKTEKKSFIRKYWFVMAAVLITITGFVLRVICCFWGKPLQLHPDEGATVDYVIEMLKRHSWEAQTFDRPDHFEIKCDAIIFTVVSWIKYHKPAYEAFEEHKMAFYMLARFYTTLFGTALIPLVGVFSRKLTGFLKEQYKNFVGLLAMVMVAFSTIFVQHSAYATPDIVLTFFIVLFAAGFLAYVDSGSKKALFLNMVIIGIGVTIKYPAAILCIPLAIMVIYRACAVDKKPSDIPKYALISMGLILFTVFVLAPNLITDITAVYKNFIEEARPTHLGADGFGFAGNLKYYFSTIMSNLGTVTMIPFILGLVTVVFHRSKEWMSLLVGLIYCVCMSALSLHWLRWGIPMYPFYIIVMAAGIGGTLQFFEERLVSHEKMKLAGVTVVAAFSILLMTNVVASGLSITKYSSLPDMRYVAMEYCTEKGITTENSLYEGYTPLAPSLVKKQVASFSMTDEGVKVNVDHGTKQYFVMSDSFKNRYFAEPDRYPDQCAIYGGLDSAYEMIYKESGNGNYGVHNSILKNLIHSIKYLAGNQTTTGDTITVYDLHPTRLTIQNESGRYLSSPSEEQGTGLQLSHDPYSWTLYEDQYNVYTFLSSASGMAIDVAEGNFAKDTIVGLGDPTGEIAQQWSMVVSEDGDACYIVCDHNMALTEINDSIYLEEYTQADNQRWKITFEE